MTGSSEDPASPVSTRDWDSLVDSFRSDGMVTIDDLLSREDVRAIRDRISHYLERIVTRFTPAVRSKLVKYEPGTDIVRRCYNLQQSDAYFAALGQREDLISIVRRFVPWEPVLFCVETFFKAPHGGSAAPLHQEVAFYDQPELRRMLAMWIPLDDVTEANGPIRYWIGSHRHGLLPHRPDASGHLACDRDAADAAAVAVRCATGRTGSASIHDGYTVHDGLANDSDQPRLALVVQYRSAPPGETGPIPTEEAS
jgi:ectoine hydroxylase-related dioxygenase (phytanoyl-CoA dioxygenase family)